MRQLQRTSDHLLDVLDVGAEQVERKYGILNVVRLSRRESCQRGRARPQLAGEHPCNVMNAYFDADILVEVQRTDDGEPLMPAAGHGR